MVSTFFSLQGVAQPPQGPPGAHALLVNVNHALWHCTLPLNTSGQLGAVHSLCIEQSYVPLHWCHHSAPQHMPCQAK